MKIALKQTNKKTGILLVPTTHFEQSYSTIPKFLIWINLSVLNSFLYICHVSVTALIRSPRVTVLMTIFPLVNFTVSALLCSMVTAPKTWRIYITRRNFALFVENMLCKSYTSIWFWYLDWFEIYNLRTEISRKIK